MILSNKYNAFDKKTLIVVMDGCVGKVYSGIGRTVKFLIQKEHDRISLNDAERYTAQISGERMMKSIDENLKERERMRFFADIVETASALYTKQAFKRLIIAAPAEDSKRVASLLHTDITPNTSIIPKLLTNMPPSKLFGVIMQYL